MVWLVGNLVALEEKAIAAINRVSGCLISATSALALIQ